MGAGVGVVAAYGIRNPSTVDDESEAPVNPLAGLSTEQILTIAKGEPGVDDGGRCRR